MAAVASGARELGYGGHDWAIQSRVSEGNLLLAGYTRRK